MKSVKDLMNAFPQRGRLELIMLRTAHRGSINGVREAQALPGIGLKGDHRDSKPARPEAKRQVTLFQAEHMHVLASILGQTDLDPSKTRRNLLVSGLNLYALKDRYFQIGDVIFEGTGLCHPCSRMEEAFGPGGYNAMRGHGGITARVIQGGNIKAGDPVTALAKSVDSAA